MCMPLAPLTVLFNFMDTSSVMWINKAKYSNIKIFKVRCSYHCRSITRYKSDLWLRKEEDWITWSLKTISVTRNLKRWLETLTCNADFQIWRQAAIWELSSRFYSTSCELSFWEGGLPSRMRLPDWKLRVIEISIRFPSKTFHGNDSHPNVSWMACEYG